MRVPLLLQALLKFRPDLFTEIQLYEPSADRRETIVRLCAFLAEESGHGGLVKTAESAEEALRGADFVFSAVRVGGDSARVIDEQVALRRGVVGQETTGPGGCAMALRTVPVMLAYAEVIQRVAPDSVVINFTNPVGIVTQALSKYGGVRAIGICDTPSELALGLAAVLGEPADVLAIGYAGLNHLGWVTSVRVRGVERLSEIVDRFEELVAYRRELSVFDGSLIRRLGIIPTEYVSYYYDPAVYLANVRGAGHSRGQYVQDINTELVDCVGKALAEGDPHLAWRHYSAAMEARQQSYMSLEAGGMAPMAQSEGPVTSGTEASGHSIPIGGYEGVALQVLCSLMGESEARLFVNVPNDGAIPYVDDDEVVEVPAVVSRAGVQALGAGRLPPAAQGLLLQVKAYESRLVDAVVRGAREEVEVALALHPLVPGLTAARELISDYVDAHREMLAYLH